MTTTSSFVSTLATLAASLLRNASVLMAASPVVWDEVVSRHLLLIKWPLSGETTVERQGAYYSDTHRLVTVDSFFAKTNLLDEWGRKLPRETLTLRTPEG